MVVAFGLDCCGFELRGVRAGDKLGEGGLAELAKGVIDAGLCSAVELLIGEVLALRGSLCLPKPLPATYLKALGKLGGQFCPVYEWPRPVIAGF